MRKNVSTWIARILIGLVTFLNLQCALLFLIYPGNFAPGFELSGIVGEAMIRAMGLLFVMWNVPYIFALIHPIKNRLSLFEAVIMQFIGVTGETILLLSLSGIHPILKASVERFIIFDASGLILLLIAVFLISRKMER